MSNDSFTEVTSEGWFSRLGGAAKGVLFGLALVVVAVVLMFWNEGRAVKRAKDLEAGAGALVSLPAPAIEASNDGALVHFTGNAVTDKALSDETFGVAASALRFRRHVEMYQWVEESESTTRKKVGGGTEKKTTYSYRTAWSDDLVDSSGFKKPEDHRNPAVMPWTSETETADDVTVGAFSIPGRLVGDLGDFRTLAPPGAAPSGRHPAVVSGDALYVSTDPNRAPDPTSPQVGDVRLTWSTVAPGPVSVIGIQTGTTLDAWRGPSGSTVFEIRAGMHDGDAMFARLESDNRFMLWAIRGGGALAVFIGLGLLFAPLGVLADVLPPIGALVRVGTGAISFLLGSTISLSTIGLGWLFYRPLLGIPLLVVAVAAVVLLAVLVRRRAASAAQDTPRALESDHRQAA